MQFPNYLSPELLAAVVVHVDVAGDALSATLLVLLPACFPQLVIVCFFLSLGLLG